MKAKTCEDCCHFYVCGVRPVNDYIAQNEDGEKNCRDFMPYQFVFDVGDTVFVIEAPKQIGESWSIHEHTICSIYITDGVQYITRSGLCFDYEMINDLVFISYDKALAAYKSVFDVT